MSVNGAVEALRIESFLHPELRLVGETEPVAGRISDSDETTSTERAKIVSAVSSRPQADEVEISQMTGLSPAQIVRFLGELKSEVWELCRVPGARPWSEAAVAKRLGYAEMSPSTVEQLLRPWRNQLLDELTDRTRALVYQEIVEAGTLSLNKLTHQTEQNPLLLELVVRDVLNRIDEVLVEQPMAQAAEIQTNSGLPMSLVVVALRSMKAHFRETREACMPRRSALRTHMRPVSLAELAMRYPVRGANARSRFEVPPKPRRKARVQAARKEVSMTGKSEQATSGGHPQELRQDLVLTVLAKAGEDALSQVPQRDRAQLVTVLRADFPHAEAAELNRVCGDLRAELSRYGKAGKSADDIASLVGMPHWLAAELLRIFDLEPKRPDADDLEEIAEPEATDSDSDVLDQAVELLSEEPGSVVVELVNLIPDEGLEQLLAAACPYSGLLQTLAAQPALKGVAVDEVEAALSALRYLWEAALCAEFDVSNIFARIGLERDDFEQLQMLLDVRDDVSRPRPLTQSTYGCVFARPETAKRVAGGEPVVNRFDREQLALFAALVGAIRTHLPQATPEDLQQQIRRHPDLAALKLRRQDAARIVQLANAELRRQAVAARKQARLAKLKARKQAAHGFLSQPRPWALGFSLGQAAVVAMALVVLVFALLS